MNEDLLESITQNPKFKELVSKQSKLSWTLALIMLVIYYGFILLIAFSPATLGTPVSAGASMTIGIPIGVMIILSAFVITGIYVRRANTEFDQLTREVVEESRK